MEKLKYEGCYYLDLEIAEKHDNLELKNLYGDTYVIERIAPDGTKMLCQFCGKGKGRINDPFACVNKGEQSCFVPQDGDIALDQKLDKLNGRFVPDKYKVEID